MLALFAIALPFVGAAAGREAVRLDQADMFIPSYLTAVANSASFCSLLIASVIGWLAAPQGLRRWGPLSGVGTWVYFSILANIIWPPGLAEP